MSGWWFGTFFIFPNSWDDDPIWLYNICQRDWNHQLDVWVCLKIGYTPNEITIKNGIMISKTIGYNGVLTIFRQTHTSNWWFISYKKHHIHHTALSHHFPAVYPRLQVIEVRADVQRDVDGAWHASGAGFDRTARPEMAGDGGTDMGDVYGWLYNMKYYIIIYIYIWYMIIYDYIWLHMSIYDYI